MCCFIEEDGGLAMVPRLVLNSWTWMQSNKNSSLKCESAVTLLHTDLKGPKFLQSLPLLLLLECSGVILANCNFRLPGSKTGFCHVGQADLELLTSNDLTASAFQSAGITAPWACGCSKLGSSSPELQCCSQWSRNKAGAAAPSLAAYPVQAGLGALCRVLPDDPALTALTSENGWGASDGAFLFFNREKISMLLGLVLHSWPQVILLFWPPKVLGLQA
ncbi:hypothetical protein AAY473_009596 [Plecturocebus cupreus]